MPLPIEQQKACERVFDVIYAHKAKGRLTSEMFKDLPDRAAWVEYYRDKLSKGKFKSAEDVHSDLELVFANAIHFNEEHSIISNDARTLQGVLKKEWDAAVSAGTLPKIEPEVEASDGNTSKQPSRASRARDVVPPAPPTIRLPKKAPAATPSASRTATLTPAPQNTTAPHQSTPQQVQAQNLPTAQPVPVPIRGLQSAASNPPSVPPAPAVTPVPVPASTEVEDDTVSTLVRDKLGDELVSQLETTYPRNPPPGSDGWMDISPGIEPYDKYAAVIGELRGLKDAGGDHPFDVLETISEETTNKTLSFSDPMSVSIIENKIKTRAYDSPADFDKDISRLFEKARKWHEEGTYPYGRVLILQCHWQTMTLPKPEDMQIDITSSNLSVPSIDSVPFKGITYRVGDWVHLANKDIPPKPIVAQIQRIDGVDSAKTLSLTWYSRPEQTVHNATRSFWEREVFKTNFTSSNPLQDIIEPVACQFFPKHIRGRPSPPMWYPGRPLYVCESRYDSGSKGFSRIKNWTSCIPEGLRKGGGDGLSANGGGWEYMPIMKFDDNKTVIPRKHPSPFLKGVVGLKKRGHGGNAGPGPQKDRSVVTAAGGPTVVPTSVVEILPEDTVKHFDRDPYTNQLLWFSGAPIETPRVRQPKHSLDYLYWLARQQEKRHRGEDVDERKRKTASVPPISTELANLHCEVFGNRTGSLESTLVTDRNADVEMSS